MADVAFTARATLIGQFLVGVVRGLAGHNDPEITMLPAERARATPCWTGACEATTCGWRAPRPGGRPVCG